VWERKERERARPSYTVCWTTFTLFTVNENKCKKTAVYTQVNGE